MAVQLLCRQCEIERASLTGFRLYPDTASVALNDLLGDCQADAEARDTGYD
jgi:hypothetical protein